MSAIIKLLIKQCEQRDIHLRVEDGQIRYRCPPGAMHPEFRERLRGYRPELIRYLSKLRIVSSNDHLDPRGRKRSVRTYRVQIDNRSLIFMDHTRVADVRGLMDKQFGADRVGAITAIGTPGSSGETP